MCLLRCISSNPDFFLLNLFASKLIESSDSSGSVQDLNPRKIGMRGHVGHHN